MVSYWSANLRHMVGSVLSGTMVGIAWMLFVDGVLIGYVGDGYRSPPWYYYFPGVVQTICFVLLNVVVLRDLKPYQMLLENRGKALLLVRLWLLGVFLLSCIPLFASVGVCLYAYIDPIGKVWPGVALVLQCALVWAASVVFLLCRKIGADEASSSTLM